jgi:hypothetical protein
VIFSTSLPRFKTFVAAACHKASDYTCCLLFVVPFLLPAGRRSVAAAARSLLFELRNAGFLLRWLGASSAPAALLAAAQYQLYNAAAYDPKRLHLLLLDSTFHSQQGTHTENTFACGNHQARPRKSERKQKKVQRRSCHGFVFALLLTPNGLRLPYYLPFYTQEHCTLFGYRHQTQADLAARLIDNLPLPKGGRVVVVGDTAFESKQLRQACGKRQWLWVLPLNPERRLAGQAPRPQVKSLYQQLCVADFRKVSFRLDQGELAALARVSPKRSKSSKHLRTYWVHHRTVAVHNVGTVALLFSTQKEPTTLGGVTVQKVLVSNALTASTQELLGWYSLRWQIELFFKEMKSELGMCQYKLGLFQRVQGWVNLSLVAFCYLEWYRWHRQQEVLNQEKEHWQRLRTHGLKDKIRQQTQRADLESLLRLVKDPNGPEQITALLNRICDDPAATAA